MTDAQIDATRDDFSILTRPRSAFGIEPESTLEARLSGRELYGDCFTNAQLMERFGAEREAHHDLVARRPSGDESLTVGTR